MHLTLNINNLHFRKNANVITLKSRYNSMYIPSDFFKANFCWMDAFPLTRPFQLGHHCEFHVLHKDVEPLNTSDALLDPPDADHSYNAKVGVKLLVYLIKIYQVVSSPCQNQNSASIKAM